MAKRLSATEERFLDVRRQGQADDGLPPPPYQVRGVHLKHIGVRFAPGVCRQLLPEQLDPVDEESGLVSVYSTTSGDGIDGFSVFFTAIAVKGYDAPDGSPAHYIATGHYSGDGATFMRRHYNLNVVEGRSRQFGDADLAIGVGTVNDADVIEMSMRPIPAEPLRAAGIRNYLGRYPGGGVCVFPIAFSGFIYGAEPVSIKIADDAPELLRLLEPQELTFALECSDMSFTYGLPQRIDDSDNLHLRAAQAELINSFAHSGRAALVVSINGEIAVSSDSARGILGDGLTVSRGRVSATHRDDEKSLQQLIAATARNDGAPNTPIALRRVSGQPLIVDAVAIGSGLTGRNSVLLLLNDPAHSADGSVGLSLQLLGLTPAEARIAEFVGSGLSPRETAKTVANSEGTVRTSLSRIYQKLGITRQAELARLVTRLEIGRPI